MSKAVKAMITEELKARYAEVESACVVSLSGLSIQAQESIRGKLREKAARVQVVKNCLARRAFRQTPLEPLGDALAGPCAIVTTSESLIDAARVLVAAAREFEGLSLKQAILEGDPNLLTVEDLSKMKGRVSFSRTFRC